MVYTVTAVCGAHTHGYVLYIPFSGGIVSGIYCYCSMWCTHSWCMWCIYRLVVVE